MSDEFVNIPIVETTDEVIHCETNLPSSEVRTSLNWRITAVRGALIQPDFHLNVQLKVYKMVGGKEEDIGKDDKLCLTNYPLASLFSSAKVEFRNKPINDNNTQFAYVAFLRALTDFDKDGRESLLGSSLWAQDMPGGHEVYVSVAANTPYLVRHRPIIKGQTVDLYGPLLLDICRMDLPFPDDVEITLTLNLAPVEFSLSGESPPIGTTYHISIIKADLCVTRARMAPGADIYEILGTQVISYPFTFYETQTIVLPKGVANASEDILHNLPPARIVLGMVDQAAYNGTIDKNPYNFLSNFISSVFLRKDQVRSIPSEPYTTAIARQPSTAETQEEMRKETEKKANQNPGQKRDKRAVRFYDDEAGRHKHRKDRHRFMRDEPTPPGPTPPTPPGPTPPTPPAATPPATGTSTPSTPKSDPTQEELNRPWYRLFEFSRLYYESLRVLNSTGGPLNRINQNISMEAFERGYCLMGFDMREDRTRSSISRALQQRTPPSTVIRFEARFHLPLAQPTVLICFLEYPRALQIPKASTGLPITVTQ